MGQQLDRGGAQPQKQDLTTVINNLLLSQRQADTARSGKAGMPTKKGREPKRV